MAVLVDADPALDPDSLLDGLPSDLWGALVIQVIGQQLSLAAAAAISARLDALHGGRLPTPAELLATDAETLRGIGLSRAKAVYLHDLAARWRMDGSTSSGCATLDDDAARTELTQVKGVGDGCMIYWLSCAYCSEVSLTSLDSQITRNTAPSRKAPAEMIAKWIRDPNTSAGAWDCTDRC